MELWLLESGFQMNLVITDFSTGILHLLLSRDWTWVVGIGFEAFLFFS